MDTRGSLTLPGSNFIEGSTRYPERVRLPQLVVQSWCNPFDSLPSRYSEFAGMPLMTSDFVDFE